MKMLLVGALVVFFPLMSEQMVNKTELIVWNVGQGQWITYIDPDHCLHFDMGGEKAPLVKIQKLCLKKKNILYLSHWDTDHISFIKNFSRRVFYFCLYGKPQGIRKSWKENLSKLLAECEQSPTQLVDEIYSGSLKGNSNSSSRVFYLKPLRLILPGDSPKAQEHRWHPKTLTDAKGLILGHHGSRTSTSDQLLAKMINLKWSVASARFKKYKHPHREIEVKMKNHQVPLLRTEHWGHLRFLF